MIDQIKQQMREIVENRASKDPYMTVIDEWRAYWMDQTQNSKEDYDNYFRRAFGVDANMQHHLAKLLSQREANNITALAESALIMLEALERAENIIVEDNCDECGTFQGVRYHVKPVTEAIQKVVELFKGTV